MGIPLLSWMDGNDYWYGNVEDINVKLYDYIEANTVIANTTDNKLYVYL